MAGVKKITGENMKKEEKVTSLIGGRNVREKDIRSIKEIEVRNLERGDRYDRKRRYEEDSEDKRRSDDRRRSGDRRSDDRRSDDRRSDDRRRSDDELRSSKCERGQVDRNLVDNWDERGWRSNQRVKTEFGEFEDARSRDNQVERVRRSPMREEVEEVSRSGNFQNWSTATVKVDTDTSIATTSSRTVSTTTNKEKSVSEEVDRLHRKVANKVMKSLNKYYPGAEEFDPNHHKIGSPEEYTRLAKQFSHQLRRKIKESYEAYNSTLEGIQLTGDHEQFIRTEVESYFETIQRIH